MKSLKYKSLLTRLLAVVAVSAAGAGAQAASYNYSGIITTCTGICSIFTAVGQSADFAFDSAASGPGGIAVGDISNVDISLSTPSGGALAFTSGVAQDSSLTIDAFDNITSGSVTLQAVGATTGIVARGTIDVDAGTWTAFVVETSGALTQIASGTGSFAAVAPVPIPAAAWLFGSALVGLAGIGRRRRI